MADTASSSSSSCTSFGSSFEEGAAGKASTTALKFLCSYGGKILPRYAEGKLRYIGGDTRALSVDPAISFLELLEKMRELCGREAVVVRCKLPTEDLDALVSVKSDEDLANVVEEYHRVGRGKKIRAFLYPLPPKPSSKEKSPAHPAAAPVARPLAPAARCCHHQISAPVRLPGRCAYPAVGNFHCYGGHHRQDNYPHLHQHQHRLPGHLQMPMPMPMPYGHLVQNGAHRQ